MCVCGKGGGGALKWRRWGLLLRRGSGPQKVLRRPCRNRSVAIFFIYDTNNPSSFSVLLFLCQFYPHFGNFTCMHTLTHTHIIYNIPTVELFCVHSAFICLHKETINKVDFFVRRAEKTVLAVRLNACHCRLGIERTGSKHH